MRIFIKAVNPEPSRGTSGRFHHRVVPIGKTRPAPLLFPPPSDDPCIQLGYNDRRRPLAFGEGANATAMVKMLLWPNNLVTLTRMVVVTGLVVMAAFDQYLPTLASSFLFVAAYWATDQIDGWLARRLKKASAFGEALDLIVDRWCDVLIAAFLLLTTPRHAVALTVFLLLRIAPEIVVGRYANRSPGMFVAVGARFVGQRLASLGVDLALILRTAFFAWALYGDAPIWAGIALVAPALVFAGMVVCILIDLAGDTNNPVTRG